MFKKSKLTESKIYYNRLQLFSFLCAIQGQCLLSHLTITLVVNLPEKQPIKKFKWERLSQGSTSADLEEDGRSRQRTDGQSGSKEASFFI